MRNKCVFYRRIRLAFLIFIFGSIYAWGEGYFSPSSIFQHDEYMALVSPGLMYTSGSWVARQTSGAPPDGRHQGYPTMLGPPHCFHYAFIAVVHTLYLIGKVFGVYGTPFDLINNWHFVELTGRTMVILCSLGAMVMTTRIARLVFASESVGIVAAILMGLSEYYLFNSKLAKVDVPMIFLTTVSMYFLLRASEERKTSQYVWSGLFCGLAAGTKLPGTFMVFPIVFVYFSNAWHGRESYLPVKLAAAGFAALVGVFGTNPNLIVYFDDFLWAIKSFNTDLKGQGGIVHPWYYYYMRWDSYRYLVTTTFPNMFAGQVSTYFALGGALIVLYKRRLKACALVAFPAFYILFNLPMLSSLIHREYHVCIFVMALLASYSIHFVYRYTVERFSGSRTLRYACLFLVLGAMLKSNIVYANWVNYYATKPSTPKLADRWMQKYIPKGSRIVVSGMVYADLTMYPQQKQYLNLIKDPAWREELANQFDYALFVSSKASELHAYCRQSARLIRTFQPLSTGYATIYLYALNPEARLSGMVGKNGAGHRYRSVNLHLNGDNPMLRIDIMGRCRRHRFHTVLLSAGNTALAVSLPTDADVSFFHIPGQYDGNEIRIEYAVLPFDLPADQTVSGIEEILSSSNRSRVATAYMFTDGSSQTVFDVDVQEFLGPLKNDTLLEETVLNPPRYLRELIRTGDLDQMEMRLLIADDEFSNTRTVRLLKKNNRESVQVQVESDGIHSALEAIRLHILQRFDPDVSPLPVDFVRVEITRRDATRSAFLYQDFRRKPKDILLPPVLLQEGDEVTLHFLYGKSGI